MFLEVYISNVGNLELLAFELVLSPLDSLLLWVNHDYILLCLVHYDSVINGGGVFR
jgi:hypothetical protein